LGSELIICGQFSVKKISIFIPPKEITNRQNRFFCSDIFLIENEEIHYFRLVQYI